MAAKIIDLSGMLELGARLRTLLRDVTEEATPQHLLDLAAEVDRALRDRAKDGRRPKENSGDAADDGPSVD